jgi:hypothetical protein
MRLRGGPADGLEAADDLPGRHYVVPFLPVANDYFWIREIAGVRFLTPASWTAIYDLDGTFLEERPPNVDLCTVVRCDWHGDRP